jgi:hypothetical protein
LTFSTLQTASRHISNPQNAKTQKRAQDLTFTRDFFGIQD